ncbi:MAG: hypothetical protein ACI4AB_02950 [Acetatifactor sp.]
MRKTYHVILKCIFYENLIRTRSRLGLTQSQMAEKLAMDDRSYIDLDHGKTCCSAVTLALFLVYVCEDVYSFVEELRNAFDAGTHRAA